MSIPCWKSPVRRVSFLSTAALLAASFAGAQSAPSPFPSAAPSFSSSTESSSLQNMAALDLNPSGVDPSSVDALPVPSAPTPSASAGGRSGAAGQDYGGGSGWKHYVGSRFAFEAGGGFNAPESSAITYGGNFTVGGGLNFNSHLGALIEYQFIQDKLPGALIAEAGAQGGHDRIWSFTIDPVIDLMPKAKNDIYITGGGGFYRKVTSFTDPEEAEYCEYYYCGEVTENAVVGHFSSNQGGFNVGAGFQHRLGGMYGDSKTKLFAEVRYLDVLSPAVISSAGPYVNSTTVAADTKLIPITLGVRF